MTEHDDPCQRTLLVVLQRGIPLAARPFAEIGRDLALDEQEVLSRVKALFASGQARRFGAVFDSRSLGYDSTLCAVGVPGADLERVAALLTPHPGVTHCYEREGYPNLWFTLTARKDRHAAQMQSFAERLAPYTLLDMPALQRFKVEVVLDAPSEGPLATPVRTEAESGTEVTAWKLTLAEQNVVRALQENIPVTAEPFADVALATGWDPDRLLELLTDWRQAGLLRRIGIILRHRQAGFTANGMCVWRVPAADVTRAGQTVAAAPEVTHCYERPASDLFPYNLFAMVHARERQVAEAVFARLSAQAGLSGGKILVSVREFKKSSPYFFCEDAESRGGA